MPRTLYWLQSAGCGGDSQAVLGAEAPELPAALSLLGIEVLWHPSLSNGSHTQHRRLLEELRSGSRPLDILCVEGAVVRGPGGTGMYDTLEGRPRKELVAALAARAGFVVAVGTCAAFGGISGNASVEGTGLQFHGAALGGFLGAAYRSGSGLPVVNLPGCPCHGEVLVSVLAALCESRPLPLNVLQAPLAWYGMLVHQGCLRNEYHEYRVEDRDFGEKGCLFFHLGCRGPLTFGPCNKVLWGKKSSKTRVGVPCHGCTHPEFPMPHAFFSTRNIAEIPLELPDGIDRAHYMAYKGMAAAAAPQRLLDRLTEL